jgi:hypothetical protein
MKTSVVVVTYRRLQSLDRVLSAWLAETPDVWLCDCSEEGFKTELPIKIIRATPDPGSKIRHAVATLTEGDIVIKADDDIIPFPGLAADFVSNMEKVGPAILSVHGRRFRGPSYYSNTVMFGSKGVNECIYKNQQGEPLPVDFVGVITCAPRELLAMDLHGCGSEIEDLFWQMEKYPEAKKYVIPTLNYTNLKESKDDGRLCAPGTESRIIRQAYYQKQYEANYANRNTDK